MKITSETKFLLGIIIVTAAIIGIAVMVLSTPTKELPRADLIPVDTNTLGSATASAYLVEFSDYECPACATFAPVIDELVNKHADKLQFAYRHFPLSQHPLAIPAAKAAEAAGLQGRFWEMHALLFANQTKLSDSLFLDLAKQIKLDLKVFESDLTNTYVLNNIDQDTRYGEKIGINSTPTFYLNGVKLNLSNPTDLITAVEKALK